MDSDKMRFTGEIAARLAAAPDSRAKSELVEELAENLVQRYREYLSAGTPEDEAFRLAMEELGDVDELIDYLNSAPGEAEAEPRPGQRPLDELLRDVNNIVQNDSLNALLRDVGDITRNALEMAKQGIRSAQDLLRDKGFSWGDPDSGFSFSIGRNGGIRIDARQEESIQANGISAEGLRGVNIRNVDGDLSIGFARGEELRLEGNLTQFEVSRSEDGTALTIQPNGTASADSLFRRGLGGDLELTLPCRDWDFIKAATANGDLSVSGKCHVETLTAETACGDISGDVDDCGVLKLKSASGDIDWTGGARQVKASSASGDIRLEGAFGRVDASTASGDVDVSFTAEEIECRSMSGDIDVTTDALPRSLSVSSKSGDCSVRLPAGEPFTARLRTVSGDVDSGFPINGIDGGAVICGEGGGPEYSVSSVSGDVRLDMG